MASGRPALAVFDAKAAIAQREIQIDGVDEILNPTWAPDGHAICFTGMSRGLTDLFVVDVASGAVRQLTSDAYADLQPAWSPDGQRIAFATDRFSLDADTLDIGPYRIGFIDPATGAITQAPRVHRRQEHQPAVGPGRPVALLHRGSRRHSERPSHGVAGRQHHQVTAVGTGISGITGTSPAMSVATRTGTVAVSVYDDGRYDIYSVPGAGGSRSPPRREQTAAERCPPLENRRSEVEGVLENARMGLPEPQTYESTEYRGRLRLEALGQPTIAFGASRFGAAVGGGISAYFSDMLGNQTLSTAVQLDAGVSNNFNVKNTAVQAAYMNQAHRWNWGVVGGQVPYLSGGFQEGVADVGGEPALVNRVSSTGRPSAASPASSPIRSTVRSGWSSRPAPRRCRSTRSCRLRRTR